MGPDRQRIRRLGPALAAGAMLAWAVPAAAQAPAASSGAASPGAAAPNAVVALAEIPSHPRNMSSSELQGVGCIALGAVTAAGAMYYSTTVTLASFASSWGIPVLAIPVAAGGYAVGCSVGATTAPGAYWLYAWLTRM